MSVVAIEQAKRSIRWISVKDRVPEDRRWVLAWGKAGVLFEHPSLGRDQFLGVTRYNRIRNGGAFDCTELHEWSFFWRRVTHWAEITGP